MATMATYLDTTPTAGPIYRHGNSDILPAWSQREAAAAEQPWTATRCHRQLRPLLTHLMALRREKTRAALKRRSESSLRQPQNPSKRPTNADDDLAGRKRVRYTYSLKGRRRQGRPNTTSEQTVSQVGDEQSTQKTKVAPLRQQAKRSFCPGEVVVATPVLSRARKHRQAWSLPSSPLMHRESEPSGDGSLQGEEQETPRHKCRDPSFKYRGYYQNSLRLVAGNTSKSSTNPCMDADWATLFRSTPTESRKMYEAIFRATEALIRTTTCSLDSPRKSNSLLAMCLRKVPQYVAACEEAEKEDAEKERALRLPSSSVSLGIYTDLESLGSDRGGWKHLRTVVRQHGIHILESACAESLLHDTFVRLLVRLCTHMKAYDEAESLMTALFAGHITSLPKGQYLYEKPDKATGDLSESTGPVASLGMLLQYMEDTGRTSAPLQQITSLLNDGHLPPAWLSTPAFSNLWHRVIRLLSSRGSPVCDDSILLGFTAAAVTCLVLSQPDDDIASLHSNESRQNSSSSAPSSVTLSSSYHTLVSILGSISAVAILQHEAASGNNDCERSFEPAILKRLSLIAQSSLTQVSQKLKGRKGQNKLEARLHYFPRQVLLMLSVFLLQPNIEAHEAAFQKFVEEASAIQKGQVYDATIALVTSVAENCGRASKSFISGVPASRSYLLALCTQGAGLISSALDYDSESSLAARLQADAAFLFASRSNDLRDLAFAENLGKNSVQTDSKRPTPSGSRDAWQYKASTLDSLSSSPPICRAAPTTALFEGYRWEEGISEWVISTPRPAARPRTVRAPSQSPAPRGKSELIILLDDCAPQQPIKGDSTKLLFRSPTRRGRFSLPASFPPSSPTTGDDSHVDIISSPDRDSSGTTTPRLPRTPLTSSSQPRNLRRQKSKQSLLNLVSDNEEEDGDESNEHDEIETKRPARVPLFDLACNTKNARRSIAPGNTQQKKSVAAYSDEVVDAITSDDELGL